MIKQFSFNPLRLNVTNEEAKALRDKAYRAIINRGGKAKRWVLKNQLMQYSGLGCPDGRITDVYMVNVEQFED